MTYMELLGIEAKKASRELSKYTTKQKNDALKAIADALVANTDEIIEANKEDLELAIAVGLKKAMQDRLMLNAERIYDIADAVRKLSALTDPVGECVKGYTLPNGLKVSQVRVPIGVVGMIYEARPNVTADAAAICLKTGNAVILRGGKEALNSNKAIVKVMKSALYKSGLASNAIQLVEDPSRDVTNEMMRLNKYLDVLIPRGGAGLIKAVKENATVPVIETGSGICHVYVDESGDLDMAVRIIVNAKAQRPSVCNAIECVLVHSSVADTLLPMMRDELSKASVELYGCERTREILKGIEIATEEHYRTEYSDYKLSIKVLDSIDEAIEHIEEFSTRHSDSIITKDFHNANRFTSEVDSACVYVNASTRFTDGGEMGFGAEIGISTQKLHARGPMGLSEMTSTKYIILGEGQIRE